MTTDAATEPATAADVLDALLAALAESDDELVREWGERMLADDETCP